MTRLKVKSVYSNIYIQQNAKLHSLFYLQTSGFDGPVIGVLASGTQDRGFKPGRSCRIFRAKKSSAGLPSERM
jgi:hypothetical protein